MMLEQYFSRSGPLAGNLACGACPRINIIADKIVRGTRSDPLFFQVVHVEPVMHHSVTRNELLNMIPHISWNSKKRSLKWSRDFYPYGFPFSPFAVLHACSHLVEPDWATLPCGLGFSSPFTCTSMPSRKSSVGFITTSVFSFRPLSTSSWVPKSRPTLIFCQ